MLIDTHCHLYFDAFAADFADVLERMAEAGVGAAIVIGIDQATNEQARRLAAAHPQLAYAAGLHPTSEFPEHVLRGGEFDAADYLAPCWDAGPVPHAIGECGIDLHWDVNPIGRQVEVFTAQLHLARRRDLPVVVHTRAADRETRDALTQVPGARGVLHCFNGSPLLLDFVDEAARRGDDWYVSFAGNLTFPKAVELRQAALKVPLDRLLVETDAPFLAPQARRGQRNEPAYVAHTAHCLAGLRGLGLPEMQRLLLANSRNCFRLDV